MGPARYVSLTELLRPAQKFSSKLLRDSSKTPMNLQNWIEERHPLRSTFLVCQPLLQVHLQTTDKAEYYPLSSRRVHFSIFKSSLLASLDGKLSLSLFLDYWNCTIMAISLVFDELVSRSSRSSAGASAI